MSESTEPLINDEYVQRIFDTLTKMNVDLDADPVLYGPRRLNEKIALCRQYLSRCQQISLQVSSDLHHLNRSLRRLKVEFDLSMQDLFANDPDVRSGKNVRDREAIATMKLRAEREEIQRVESATHDLESVMTVVRGRREDLKDVQGRIRDQVKLCQEEIGLGGKWGSALGPGVKPVNLDAHPKVNPVAVESMNILLGGFEGDSSITDLEAYVQDEVGEVLEEVEDVVVEAVAVVSTPSIPDVVPEPTGIEPEMVLPDISAQPEPQGTSDSSDTEIDDFLSDLEGPSSGQVVTVQKVPSLANDVDLDDLINSFST